LIQLNRADYILQNKNNEQLSVKVIRTRSSADADKPTRRV